MYALIIVIIGSLFTSCANLDVASQALKKGDFNTSYKIYSEWAKRGNPKALYKVSKFAQRNFIIKPSTFIINNALKAYKKGSLKAANILFIEYYKLGNIRQSRKWFYKIIISNESLKFYRAYLGFISHNLPLKKQFIYIKNLEKYALKAENTKALYTLGQFYKSSIYIDYKKSQKFYQLAYKKGNLDAGIALGVLYIYKINQIKKGYKLLKKIASKDNGRAAFEIANYRLKVMNNWLQNYNRPTIIYTFKRPKDFFIKKIKLEELRNIYLKKIVEYWFNFSYKEGYIPARMEMIAIDNKYNAFGTDSSISYVSLKEAIEILEDIKLFKAKMVLAKIYEFHPELKKIDVAKQIYTQYIQINKDDAYWHLYQLYKRYFPKNKKIFFYLNYLVSKHFEPAIIEKAYWNILDKKDIVSNVKLLQFYTERGNISASTYLASIYSKNIYKTKRAGCTILKKLSKIEDPINATLDLKITKCFQPQELVKKATVYKYYSDKNISQASYELFKIYNKFDECRKEITYLKKSIDNGSRIAELAYAKLAVSQNLKIKGINPIQILKYYAKRGNTQAIIYLADAYYQGFLINQNIPKALELYNKAYRMGSDKAIYKIINIYKALDISMNFNKINTLFLKIKNRDYNWKASYALFLFHNQQFAKAKNFIYSSGLDNYADGQYLLYKITGNKEFIRKGAKNIYTNPNFLLLYAKEFEKYSKKKALYYTYISSFLGSQESGIYILKLLKYFAHPKTIEKIYKKAQQKAKDILKIRNNNQNPRNKPFN